MPKAISCASSPGIDAESASPNPQRENREGSPAPISDPKIPKLLQRRGERRATINEELCGAWGVYDETTRRGVNTYPACLQGVVSVVEHLHFFVNL